MWRAHCRRKILCILMMTSCARHQLRQLISKLKRIQEHNLIDNLQLKNSKILTLNISYPCSNRVRSHILGSGNFLARQTALRPTRSSYHGWETMLSSTAHHLNLANLLLAWTDKSTTALLTFDRKVGKVKVAHTLVMLETLAIWWSSSNQNLRGIGGKAGQHHFFLRGDVNVSDFLT